MLGPKLKRFKNTFYYMLGRGGSDRKELKINLKIQPSTALTQFFFTKLKFPSIRGGLRKAL